MTLQATKSCPLQVFVCASRDATVEPTLDFIRNITGVHADISVVSLDGLPDFSTPPPPDQPRLIVLTQETTEDGAPLNGIDTAEIAMNSPTPVMVLRAPRGEQVHFPAFNRILVPLDGSARAAQALPLATHIAKGAGLPVYFVMVIDPSRVIPPAFAYDPEAWSIVSELRETAHWALRQAEEPLIREGVQVDSALVYGPVNACLQAEIRPTDMVVMTTHGAGKARARIGSVAARVLESAAGPVVIHRGSDQGDIVVDGYEACSWVEPLSRRTGMASRQA